ncbi:MAG: efflux RND transporter periplasmic adaptor subunit [Planctomycetaceae bacterium]|jgi:HlyD family secretion protein|nr:efflux RND transporter periplasmic adaptor subunit [Planctomycetaceae bacterium]
MIKKIIVLLFLLLILFGGGYFFYQYYAETKQGVGDDCLILYGNVEIRRVNLGFRVFGRISEIFFEEGGFIKKGEMIACLDREPYEDTYAVAVAQVEIARENCAKLEAGYRSQEIKQARATLNGRIANLNVLESDLKRSQQLLDGKVVTIQEFENVEARRDEAVAQKKIAEENLNLLLEGYRKEDIAAAKSQLAEAKANLKKAETAIKDTILFCPNDGILLTRIEEVGSVVNAGQIIATISLKDAVWVYVYVSELQLGRLAPGMKAEIYTDTQPDKPYTGQVGYISPEAEFTPKNVETTELRTALVYRVRIIADNPDNGLRQGMPVTVKLLLNQ